MEKGFWSNEKKKVKIIGFDISVNTTSDFGYLDVYFDKSTWNSEKDGLIYTDKTWFEELKSAFVSEFSLSKKAADDIDYSEQGMQGNDCVSLDCGPYFVKEYFQKFTRRITQ